MVLQNRSSPQPKIVNSRAWLALSSRPRVGSWSPAAAENQARQNPILNLAFWLSILPPFFIRSLGTAVEGLTWPQQIRFGELEKGPAAIRLWRFC
jgi:hypothetical protein